MAISLVEPCHRLQDKLFSYVRSFDDRSYVNGAGVPSCAEADLPGMVQRLLDHARGVSLPPGWVPCSTFWAMDGDELAGMINLRHFLSPALRVVGGNVGYSVHPALRGRGHATEMLRLLLPIARGMGMDRLLLTCDKRNAASARVIVKNGGEFERDVPLGDGTSMSHYWILL